MTGAVNRDFGHVVRLQISWQDHRCANFVAGAALCERAIHTAGVGSV